MRMPLKNKLLNNKKQLPKKQQKLCDYILKNFEHLGLITIKELSHKADVGISTVMRTIHALDYENFNDFRRDIYNEALPNETKFTLQTAFIENEQQHSDPLTSVWDKSVQLLNHSLKDELVSNFNLAIDYIENAASVSILGTRPYKATALYLEQLLNEFYFNIHQLSHDLDAMFDKIIKLTSKDVLVVFAFEPYTNSVINAVKEANRLNIPIILITDYDSSPLLVYATVTLKVAVQKNHFTVLPIIALIDAMILKIGNDFSKSTVENLKQLEDALDRNNVTYRDENYKKS